MFVDGSHVVLLTPLPGGSASNAARSLFGSSGGLASLRSKLNCIISCEINLTIMMVHIKAASPEPLFLVHYKYGSICWVMPKLDLESH